MKEDDLLNMNEQHKFSFRKLIGFIGPGLLVSIAYIDPGNLSGDILGG